MAVVRRSWPRALYCLLLLAASIVVVPIGEGGVRVSASSGTLAGTLNPGVHFVTPLAEHVELFDLSGRLFTTGAARGWSYAGRCKE